MSFHRLVPVEGGMVSIKVCKSHVEMVVTESTIGAVLGQQITFKLSPQSFAALNDTIDTAMCYFDKSATGGGT